MGAALLVPRLIVSPIPSLRLAFCCAPQVPLLPPHVQDKSSGCHV